MEKDKKPVPGQIGIGENGSIGVYVDEDNTGKKIKKEYFTPDSVRDKEIGDLRRRLRNSNIRGWIQFVVGIGMGLVIMLLL